MGLELWFKTDVASDPLLYRKDGYDDDEAYWALEIFNSKIIFEGLTKDGSPFSLTSSSEIEFDKWIHCSVLSKAIQFTCTKMDCTNHPLQGQQVD